MTNIFLLLILHSIAIQCVEINKEIYYEIPNESVSHCVRRLNSTSTIGCSSKFNGNVGVVDVAFNESDLRNRLTLMKEDTVLIINTNLFVRPNITNILTTNPYITGLIIFEQENCNGSFCHNDTPKSFSEDYKRPNKLFSFSTNITFNPSGTQYAFKNWPFPIALIEKRHKVEQDKIMLCYYRFNSNSSSDRRCALEIKNFMAAVKSGDICLEYQNIQNRFAGLFHPVYFCNDFTGMNYIVSAMESVKSREPDSVIVLISRLDSLSMFEKSAYSTHGAITSAALLLSVMNLLMNQDEFKKPERLKKDVLFLLLDNESYDYLGSNRFFLDLEAKNTAKSSGVAINTTHLDLLLEFGELGFANFSEIGFFYPTFNDEEYENKTRDYVSQLAKSYEKFGYQNTVSMKNLPPSSIQFFLRNVRKSAIVMADHQDKLLDPFYNSFLDGNPLRNNSLELLAIVNAVASFVFQEATGKNFTNKMNLTDIASPYKIIECFTSNIRCDLLKNVLTFKTIENLHSIGTPIPTQAHSGTKEISRDYRFSYLLRNLVVYLSGQEVNNSICQTCSKCDNFVSIKTGNDTERCFNTHMAYSDEFSYPGVVNGPMWVTSNIVDKQSIRMFVRAPNRPLLVTGLVLTGLIALFMILISSRQSEIFHFDL